MSITKRYLITNLTVEYNRINSTAASPRGLAWEHIEQPSTIVPVEYHKDSLYLWILTTITIVGFLGNTVSVATISKLHPVSSSSLCIIFLAITDTLCLLSKTVYMQLSHHNVNMGDSGCKVFPYAMNTLPMISNWIIVLMTSERFLATWFPLWIYKITTLRSISLLIFGITMFFLAMNSVHLVLFKQVTNPNGRFYCLPHKDFTFFVTRVWFWTEGSFAVLVPCVSLIVLNTLIILGARMSFQPGSLQKRKQQAQLTAMLVTVSVVFIILTIPGLIFSMVIGKWHYYAPVDLKEPSTVVRILSDLNHAINFFLYFLSGRRFRAHLFRPNDYIYSRRGQSV